MLNETKLRQLIFEENETSTVDYKFKPYRLDIDVKKSEFIKDILAMANTPREQSAFIVLGVKLEQDGTRVLESISTHPDDADLHEALNRAGVSPQPDFLYQPFILDGKSFGLIEITVDRSGPFFGNKDFYKVKAGRIYYRQGTRNTEAATSPEFKKITAWFNQPMQEKGQQTNYVPQPIEHWDEISHACHGFDTNRLYVLAIGADNSLEDITWSPLSKLPISLVLDFDPSTQRDGAYSQVQSTLRQYRSLHLWTLGNQSPMQPERACYWYAARGLIGKKASLVDSDWRKWNRTYGHEIQNLFELLVRSSAGRPITFIGLWYAPEYLREICVMADRICGDAVDYVFLHAEADKLQTLADQFAGQTVKVPLRSVLFGVDQNIVDAQQAGSVLRGIPNADDTFSMVDQQTYNWLSEDLVILHSNIEIESRKTSEEPAAFLQGATITWQDLDNHVDADRDKADGIERLIERELHNRSNIRINLFHWPGAGGTTLARRLAWNLRRRFPVILLNRVVHNETTNRFRRIFQLTGQPILAVVEGADIAQDLLQELYTELRAENIPVTFVNVIRRFVQPAARERTVFLGTNLSNAESYRFAEKLKAVVPEKSAQLDEIVRKPTSERTSFLFALTAYGKDYVGLSRYVESRLKVTKPIQKSLMVFIAFAYFYGHRPVSSQIFAKHLGLPSNRPIRLDRQILGDPQLELLIQESSGFWRPIHQIVAGEILKTVLAGSGDPRNWKHNLVSWSLDFIRLCRDSAEIPSDHIIDLVRRIFILRNESEILGTESSASSDFSTLILDIQTDEGRLSVLSELVDSFPNEAHFWGHLGRVYSITMKEPEKAIECIDRALELSPNDPVLHHMRGMCFRTIVFQAIDKARPAATLEEGMNAIQKPLKSALEAFDQASTLDSDSEHALISPIQMLLRALDFGYVTSGNTSRLGFLAQQDPTASWYRELLDEAEYLLEQAKQVREGDNPSNFIIRCQADLDRLYDDYEKALQGWSNLLSQTTVYAPPIRRQIARAYLTRKERKWENLSTKEIERIVDLMENNLREEPSSEKNMRLWFQAIRHYPNYSIDLAIDTIANWRTIGDSPDSYYYLYILHVLKAVDGSVIESQRASELIEQSRIRSRNLKNRTRSYEWLGRGDGIGRLVNSSNLGEWSQESNFYRDTSQLFRVNGQIADIRAPESGRLEMESTGLKVFFVPAKVNVVKGRDENRFVSFLVGFSYDGLRAWSVVTVD